MDQGETHAREPIGSPAPVRRGDRIAALDVYRGFAVLAILLLNIEGMALPHEALGHPFDGGVRGWLDKAVYVALEIGIAGTARGAFGLLFGAGVILLTARLEAAGRSAADIHLRRNMWLIAFGIVHAYVLLWFWDILYIYGLCGVFLYVFRKLRPRTLFVLAAVASIPMMLPAALGVAGDYAFQREALALEARAEAGATLGADDPATLKEWHEWRAGATDPEDVAEQIERFRGGYADIWLAQKGEILKGHTKETYRWLLWDSLAFMLVGMGLFKLGILTGERSTRFYWAFALAAYAVALPMRAFGAWLSLAPHDLPAVTAWGWPLYEPARMAMTLGHAGMVMLFARFFGAGVLAYMLAACGRMALTNYVAQTVLGVLFFWGVGLGFYNALSRAELMGYVLVVWTLQLVWSPLWLMAFRFGPLEWLWRSLTYWKPQPILRSRAAVAAPAPPDAPG